MSTTCAAGADNCLPKVGIWPTVDGRVNVRKTLEERILAQARNAAELIGKHLRYPDGRKVECVIPERCISGVAEAQAVEERFRRENVGLVINCTSCWCYGSEVMCTNPHWPKAVWGFNGTKRPGAVYLAAMLAGYAQKGFPVFGIYGEQVQETEDTAIPEDVQTKLLRFVKSGLAVAQLRNRAYLSIGGVSMGIAGSEVDTDFFQSYLGMRNEFVDMSEILRRINLKIYDPQEYERALKWTKANCREGFDPNPAESQRTRQQKDQDWETAVKMTLIARDLMLGNEKLDELGFVEEARGHGAIAAGFQGQRHWTDFMPSGDFLETILNSSFDWDGVRSPQIVATENDSLNAVTMLFGKLLTNTAQVFADVRTCWTPESLTRVTGCRPPEAAAEGLIHLINSGSAALDGSGQQNSIRQNGAQQNNGQENSDRQPALKPYWEITESEVRACLDAATWHPVTSGFRGGGFSVKFATRGSMPITMARLNLVKGLGPFLQLAEGYSVELPEAMHKILDERATPSWPTTWFAPRLTGAGAFRSVHTVMNNWGANHASFSYGHIGADLLTLAALLRIPVSMHNVPEADIFRPAAWAAFGTSDLESADYRACHCFGPFYE